ncbi:MAG: hypothetical protein KJ667_04770, partial [Alphaproteobacteria bacterium]|nr:hypothetical protein [Alphaproteobacteria bacterium]
KLTRAYDYQQTIAGQLGLTMDDVITALHMYGVSAETITHTLLSLGDKQDDVNAALEIFGITSWTVADAVGKQVQTVDALTQSYKDLTEAAASYRPPEITAGQAARGAYMKTFTEEEIEARRRAMEREGYNPEQIKNATDWMREGYPTYQHGGPILEDTLLMGLKSLRPYAVAHKGETVVNPSDSRSMDIRIYLDSQVLAEKLGVHRA